MVDAYQGPVTCVACGEAHIRPDELRTATRIGISFVHRECSWTLRYPGMSASEVIEALEARLGEGDRQAVVAPTANATANGASQQLPVDDPEAQATVEVAQGTVGMTVPCAVCNGDGELGEGDALTICGRCNGEGKVTVG